MPRFENLNPKSRDFKSRLGGCETSVINGKLFSKTDLKTENNPQPDPSVQPKARGILHMEREYIAHHIRRRNSGPRAPHSLDAARRILGRLLEALERLQA